ncbi:GNAT family N-acetyltransferase [Halomonas mongoliensis]|uniref:GNAT family N-acetyltransferase n=1 Tax=Halomonas mongoliensis TaxID=321265 RepID=UPI00403AD285
MLGSGEVAHHSASIVRLAHEEQARQAGKLLRDIDIDAYLDKLLAKADLAVLEVDHRCCGFCAFYTYLPDLGTAFITLFLVAPDVRRNGMARDMLEVVAASAAQRGFHSLTLRVRDDNAPAIRFYLAQGFKVLGRHDGDLEMRLEMTAFGTG